MRSVKPSPPRRCTLPRSKAIHTASMVPCGFRACVLGPSLGVTGLHGSFERGVNTWSPRLGLFRHVRHIVGYARLPAAHGTRKTSEAARA